MFENKFKKPVQNKENCKIKIKNSKSGRQIEFSGNCSKEQLKMAQLGFNDGSADIEEE